MRTLADKNHKEVSEELERAETAPLEVSSDLLSSPIPKVIHPSHKGRKKKSASANGADEPPSVFISLPLQEARLKRGWPLEEVAQRLCLREEIVGALEEERWGYFSLGPAYVLGFIQAYGKLMDCEIEGAVARFRAFQTQDPPPKLTATDPQKETLAPHKPTSVLFWSSLVSSLLITFCFTPLLKPLQSLDVKGCLERSERPVVSRKKPTTPEGAASEESPPQSPVMGPLNHPGEAWWEKRP